MRSLGTVLVLSLLCGLGCSDNGDDAASDASAATDLAVADAAGGVTLSGSVTLGEAVVCGDADEDDCKGKIIVVACVTDGCASEPTAGGLPQLIAFSPNDTDLSEAGASYDYSISNVSPGALFVTATFSEDNSLPVGVGSLPPNAIVADFSEVTVEAGADKVQDLELVGRWGDLAPPSDGGAGDAGAGDGGAEADAGGDAS